MEEVYAKLRGRFVFGKWQKHHGKYSGKVVEQDISTYEVTYHQIPDIEASIRTVTLAKEQQVMSPDSLIDASVAAELRSIVGSAAYFARESRPDIAGEAAICQGMFPRPMIKDLAVMNRMFKKLIQRPVKITYRYVNEPRWLLQSDAAWANVVQQGLREETCEVEKVLGQAGWIVALTSKEGEDGVDTTFNLMGWRSHHIDRHVPATS